MDAKGQKRKKKKYYCAYHKIKMTRQQTFFNRCFEKNCNHLIDLNGTNNPMQCEYPLSGNKWRVL